MSYFCGMIEFAKHIETLLLENDCVIVPGLGGFVAHYTPATYVEEECLFLPPTRLVGFNPQLKMNDGLLVQLYMTVYGTTFSDATKRVEKAVESLLTMLHEEGKADLPNVGELRYSIHGTCDFTPYDHKITTPRLYGWHSFEMPLLAALDKPATPKLTVTPRSVQTTQEKPRYVLRPYLTAVGKVAAMVAVVLLSFFFSAPIENTEVVEANYAQLLPEELFSRIEKESLVMTPIALPQPQTHATKASQTASVRKQSAKKEVKPVAVREVKVKAQSESAAPAVRSTETPSQPKVEVRKEVAAKPVATITKRYHLIVASVGTEKDAEQMAAQLKAQGHSDAKAIVGDGKKRVSIASFATHAEATQRMNELRQQNAYAGAWVLKK